MYGGKIQTWNLQETKRPSKEMQVSIARQLGLQPTTVGNFFMNARRRLHDKWQISEHDHATSTTSTHQISTITTNPGAKIENNNDNSSNMAACIMVDYPHSSAPSSGAGHISHHPDSHHDHDHDLDGFSLDSFEPVTSEAAAASCVYSLTSLWSFFDESDNYKPKTRPTNILLKNLLCLFIFQVVFIFSHI